MQLLVEREVPFEIGIGIGIGIGFHHQIDMDSTLHEKNLSCGHVRCVPLCVLLVFRGLSSAIDWDSMGSMDSMGLIEL